MRVSGWSSAIVATCVGDLVADRCHRRGPSAGGRLPRHLVVPPNDVADGCVADSTSVPLAPIGGAGKRRRHDHIMGEGHGKTWTLGVACATALLGPDAGRPGFGRRSASSRTRSSSSAAATSRCSPARGQDVTEGRRGNRIEIVATASRGAQAARPGPEDQAHAQPARPHRPAAPPPAPPRPAGRSGGRTCAPTSSSRPTPAIRPTTSSPSSRSSRQVPEHHQARRSSATPSAACRSTR